MDALERTVCHVSGDLRVDCGSVARSCEIAKSIVIVVSKK